MQDHPNVHERIKSGKLTLLKHSESDSGAFSLTLGTTISTSGTFTQHGPLLKFSGGEASNWFGTMSPGFDDPATFLLLRGKRATKAWVFATDQTKQSFEVEGHSISKRYQYHRFDGRTFLGYQGGRGWAQYFDSTFVTLEPTGEYTFDSYSHIVRDGQAPEGTLHLETSSGPYAVFDQYVVLNPGRVKMELWTISGNELITSRTDTAGVYKEIPYQEP